MVFVQSDRFCGAGAGLRTALLRMAPSLSSFAPWTVVRLKGRSPDRTWSWGAKGCPYPFEDVIMLMKATRTGGVKRKTILEIGGFTWFYESTVYTAL